MRSKRTNDVYAPVLTDDKWGVEERKSYTVKPAAPVEWKCENPWVNYMLKSYFKGWK